MVLRDRRKHYRLQIRMSIRVEGCLNQDKYFSENTETVNVSLEGLSFRTKQELAIGQIVMVSVADKCRVEARVIWAGQKDREGWCEVGAQLIPPVTDWVIQ
jgi:hypothetical protein